ncbi:ThuA domain-containing protein [Pseudonocardia humida]|uniref:ThuA domain-containing protein n=1 Tax=Pseudonocardia humida TaxID=2800819 RepID=A0ABT0ZTT7_9PSEU|nr:ThuA domain-containing protein [Pseudonocardia humida]MCO1654124.1 ThuA domain-containing protein [Pseudonocardia humida]
MGERQALVVRGGWTGHHPVEATDMFLPHLRANGFDVRVEDSPGVYAEADYMAGVDLVVQCMTMSTIADDELAGLTAAVRAGTGLAGWHGGIADSYRASSDYLHMVGGQFACHPPKAPDERRGEQADYFIPYRVRMVPGAEHPIIRGIDDFDLVTEQYWVLTDEYVDVLATTTLDAREFDAWHRPVTSPAVWTRRWGQGRVFVCTPGHDLDVLRVPQVTTIIERGLLWAAR